MTKWGKKSWLESFCAGHVLFFNVTTSRLCTWNRQPDYGPHNSSLWGSSITIQRTEELSCRVRGKIHIIAGSGRGTVKECLISSFSDIQDKVFLKWWFKGFAHLHLRSIQKIFFNILSFRRWQLWQLSLSHENAVMSGLTHRSWVWGLFCFVGLFKVHCHYSVVLSL